MIRKNHGKKTDYLPTTPVVTLIGLAENKIKKDYLTNKCTVRQTKKQKERKKDREIWSDRQAGG